MNTMKKLTLSNLRRNRMRTVVTIVGIMLSAALMTVVTGIVTSGRQTLLEAELNRYGDWTVELTGAFNQASAENLAQHRAVEAVYEQTTVGFAAFDSKSTYTPYIKLIGMSENSFENCHRSALAEGHYPTSAGEILLTPEFVSYSNTAYHAGDTITLDVGGRWAKDSVEKDNLPAYMSEKWYQTYRDEYSDIQPETEEFITEFTKTYTVAGILKEARGDLASDSNSTAIKLFTGATYDNSLRSAVYADRAVMQLKLFDDKAADYKQVLGDLTGLNQQDVNNWLNDETGTPEEMTALINRLAQNDFAITDFRSNYPVLRVSVFAVSETSMQVLSGIATVVLTIIILSSVFIIRNSFAISITEKTRLYGMLSSVGATPRQIRRNVLFEGFVLAAVGIPLGVSLGVGVTALLTTICNALLHESLNGETIAFCVSLPGIALAVVLSALTIFFSTFFIALRASRIAPVDAIRSTKDVKLKQTEKSYKTPKLIEKLFGVGGAIAYKNLKRSRKKYRATVISIVASVALFLSVFSFVTYTFDYSSAYVQVPEFNIRVYGFTHNESYRAADAMFSAIKRLDDAQRAVGCCYSSGINMTFDKTALSNDIRQAGAETSLLGSLDRFDGSETVDYMPPYIFALDNESYRTVCDALGLRYDDVKDKGIINNSTYTLTDDDSDSQEVRLLQNPKGVTLSGIWDDGETEGGAFTLELAGETNSRAAEQLSDIELLYEGSILVSLDWMEKNLPDDIYPVTPIAYIQSSNPDKTEQELSDTLGAEININNYAQQTRIMQSITLVVEIFVYGFILVISLIGITNIFNTISTNMRLRSREFAMLRSIGMTRREFNRMIRLESVFYTAKSLLIGIPLGLLGGWLIKVIYSRHHEVAYQFPWLAILISIAAVLLVVWAIMHYSIAKVRRQNIIETIRNENV